MSIASRSLSQTLSCMIAATLASSAAETTSVPFHDLELTDHMRVIPIRVWLPPKPTGVVPTIIFSHGLGGSRSGYSFLARAWSAAGYVVILPTHVGSDTATIAAKGANWRTAMAQAIRTPENLTNRPKDVACILDQLDQLPTHLGVAGFSCDAKRVGVGGHSFGAWTTLAVAGMRIPVLGDLSDPRPRAFVALSPGGPSAATVSDAGRAVTKPVLIMTGTKDHQPAFLDRNAVEHDYHWRVRTFDLLPPSPGDKWLAILDGAAHCAFSDGAGAELTREPAPEPWMTAAIVSMTTTFWNATLRDDTIAATQLDVGMPDAAPVGRVIWKKR